MDIIDIWIFDMPTASLHLNFYLLALASAETLPPVRAALGDPRRGHRQPLHERDDGADGSRHRRRDRGGLRRPGGEDLLGRRQDADHQAGLHQRHPTGDHHLRR